MSSSHCEVYPPTSPVFADGVKVYRCTGMAGTINDSDADILYGVYLVIQSSLGHRIETDQRDIVASPGSSSSGPYYADIPAADLPSGSDVTFTCQIGLTAGFAGTDLKTSQLTIE